MHKTRDQLITQYAIDLRHYARELHAIGALQPGAATRLLELADTIQHDAQLHLWYDPDADPLNKPTA